MASIHIRQFNSYSDASYDFREFGKKSRTQKDDEYTNDHYAIFRTGETRAQVEAIATAISVYVSGFLNDISLEESAPAKTGAAEDRCVWTAQGKVSARMMYSIPRIQRATVWLVEHGFLFEERSPRQDINSDSKSYWVVDKVAEAVALRNTIALYAAAQVDDLFPGTDQPNWGTGAARWRAEVLEPAKVAFAAAHPGRFMTDGMLNSILIGESPRMGVTEAEAKNTYALAKVELAEGLRARGVVNPEAAVAAFIAKRHAEHAPATAKVLRIAITAGLVDYLIPVTTDGSTVVAELVVDELVIEGAVEKVVVAPAPVIPVALDDVVEVPSLYWGDEWIPGDEPEEDAGESYAWDSESEPGSVEVVSGVDDGWPQADVPVPFVLTVTAPVVVDQPVTVGTPTVTAPFVPVIVAEVLPAPVVRVAPKSGELPAVFRRHIADDKAAKLEAASAKKAAARAAEQLLAVEPVQGETQEQKLESWKASLAAMRAEVA